MLTNHTSTSAPRPLNLLDPSAEIREAIWKISGNDQRQFLQVCSTHFTRASRVQCSQRLWHQSKGTWCAHCKNPRNSELELCDFAYELPSLKEKLKVSPLLLVSRQIRDESWPLVRGRLALTFGHVECLLAVLPTLIHKQREILYGIRYCRTITVQHQQQLKDRKSALDLTSVLMSVFIGSSKPL
jgi:hypothetical protein